MICSSCGRSNRPTARFCGTCGTLLITTADTPITAGTFNGSSQLLTPGSTLGPQGRYRIDRMLGKGGFGETYRALDTALGRFCVVKRAIISPAMSASEQQELLNNFAREAQLLVTLNEPGHDNIPEIYEYLADDRCLVMKYIEGRSLEDVLNRQVDSLPEEVALRYIRAVCSALVYMHGRSTGPVLHRDLKPANILLGNDGRVWLIDFGLAKMSPTQHTHPSSGASLAAGTLGYTPPEQWRGAAEARSDIYALGATLHHLLTNHRPNKSDLLALMQGRDDVFSPVRQLNPAIRSEVEQLVSRALVADVAARPTAQAFLTALDALLAQPQVPPPPEPSYPPMINDFVGRSVELEGFKAQLSNQHLAVITGLAGVGKTTLARALAQQVGDRVRTFWHSFHKDESINGVIWELAGFLAWHGQDDLWRLLNISNQSGGQAPPFEVLLDYLLQTVRGQGYLLCFDDVQFVDDDPLFERLLSGLHQTWQSGGGAVIITSRHVPTFVRLGEIVPLPGLNLVDTRHLLTQRGVVLPGDLIDELYRRTEGNAQFLTLAIDALRRANNPAKLIARLTEASDIERYLLREVNAGLNNDERDVMGVVAVLLGYGGTRNAIETILDTVSARGTLHDLSMRHLLTVTEGETEREYGQHAIVQAFYYDSLKKSVRQDFHRRAGAYYETEELDTLKAARHYGHAGEYERAATLATTDIWVQINRGQARGVRQVLEMIPNQLVDVEQRVAVNSARGEIDELLGENDSARIHYQQALHDLATLMPSSRVYAQTSHVYRGIGESLRYTAPQEALSWLRRGLGELSDTSALEQATLHVRIGTVLTSIGDYHAAAGEFEEGLRLLPDDAHDWRANALSNLGVIYCSQGDAERGTACYRSALALYEQSGNLWKMNTIWQNLGIEMEIAGDWAGALEQYRRALIEAERLGSVTRQAELEQNLGDLLAKYGDTDAAMFHLSRCLSIARTHNLKEHLVSSQVCMAELWLRLEEWGEAEQSLQEAHLLTQELQSQDQLPEIFRHWAHIYLMRDMVEQALDAIEQSLRVARELTLDLEIGKSLRVLGEVFLACGQKEKGLSAFQESLIVLNNRDPYEAARTKATWGQALLDRVEAEQGHMLLAEAQAVFETLRVDWERSSDLTKE